MPISEDPATPARERLIPVQPHPPRFTALLISPIPEQRLAWSRNLRGVGVARMLEAAGIKEALSVGRATMERGLCVLESVPPELRLNQVVQVLGRQGWDRLVLITPRRDAQTVRQALAAHIRTLVVATKSALVAIPTPADRTGAARRLDLSEREVQVVQLVADGHTNRSAGEVLNLSALTVKSHLARIGRKLGTGDRAQIVATCMRARVIT